jgi:hypothetical protein
MPPPTVFRTSLTLPAVLAATEVPAELQNELCASDRPLALLPVRLETRFFLQPDSSYELRVRVYPDKIHIDSHETSLTGSEAEWDKHYWEQDWRAGSDENARSAAWRQLAERFGAHRAAWIARALKPRNPEDRPTSPVAADKPLPKPIKFPETAAPEPGKDFSWQRAPLARLLPDRWIAIAYSEGKVAATATGKDIKRPLAVGPDPQKTPAGTGAEELALDDGMKWMVDFDEAENVGMALRIKVSAQAVSAGIDNLIVVGAAKSVPANEAADQFGALLDAHHYTDGLSFLKTGTPTNNTEMERSGYSSYDSGQQTSVDAEMTSANSVADADSNARRLGIALGFASDRIPDVLGGVTHAVDRYSLDLHSMNTALWSTTWGYFLTNMIGVEGTGLTADIIGWAREHFINYVRSLGPYAAIRCARQPYGVLPVTSLDLWQAPANDTLQQTRDAWLRNMLISLRDNVWRGQLSTVPRVGRTDDAANDLAEVMRSDAQSTNYAARAMLGNHYLLHLRAFMEEDLERLGWLRAHDARTAPILQKLGIAWRPRMTRSTYDDHAWGFISPLVQAGEISVRRPLEPNYIAALLAEPTIQDILDRHVQVLEGGTLLHALLRHAMLLEYAGAATAILSGQGPTLNGQDTTYNNLIKDPELVNLMPASQPTMTWNRQLDQVVPAVTGSRTLRAYLESLTDFQSSSLAALGEFRASLAHLAALDTETLQYLTQGVLDLASRRLDGWITSFATKRLSMMRAEQPRGLYVGGYAWVENLRPAAPLVAATPPANEPAPLFLQPNDTGFIHAPSLAHASTAALLRNAHLGHNGAAAADSPFAIDLSSRRMREAQQILDGVRQGQPLGALLGYRFERRLHEMSMDRFIDDFRAIAPLTADRLAPPAEPLENVAPNNVVDGLALNQKWPSQKSHLQTLTGQSYPAIERELVALGETIDALADALTAETAYQIVRGNNSRIASTLQAVATGAAPPPELEVAHTPRTGIALTHRVVTLFSAGAGSTVGWAAASTSARAKAEPVLNGWAAQLLGDPRNTRCIVEQLNATDAVVETYEVKLSELGLTPIDVVFSVDAQPRAGSLTEVEQRVLMCVRRNVAALTDNTRLQLATSRPGNWTTKDLLLQDVVDQARAARRILSRSRALDANDLDLPERNVAIGVDLKELGDRATEAETALKDVQSTLKTLIAEGPHADAESLRRAISDAAWFGVLGGVPVSQKGDDPEQRSLLLVQANALLKDLQSRIDKGEALRTQSSGEADLKKRDQILDRIRTVFGQDFIAMPSFTCANGSELKDAQAATIELQGGDSLAAYSWFTRCERVRDPLAALGDTLRGSEVLNTGARLDLRVVQLPFNAHDRWAALPIPEGQSIGSGRLSLAIQSSGLVDTTKPVAGLLIDEWVEVIPNKTETTAITFQYNPPDVCAPQSILLAVPPLPGKAWTGWDLQRVLIETLDLAKLRAVDAAALTEVSHFLPAIYFGFNADNAAVSTDFAPLTR